jgi:cytoskeletal protein RodZ
MAEMSGVGELLRSHRMNRGVALEQIADATRITVRQLEALEAEAFDELPGGVFRVSFVRQFARCIGADEEEAVRLLKSQINTSVELPSWENAPRTRDPFLGGTPGSRLTQMISGFLRDHGSALASVTVGLLLIVGGLYSYQSWEVQKQQDAQQARAADQGNAAESAPPPTSREEQPVVQTASLEPASPSAPIELEIEIVDTVWIRAVADGERVLEGIYRAGGKLDPIEAKNQVTLKVGNAGGVSLALNGKELGLVGPRGHVRSLKVTPDGMEILEATPPAGAPSQESVRVPTTTASLRWAELAWSVPAIR